MNTSTTVNEPKSITLPKIRLNNTQAVCHQTRVQKDSPLSSLAILKTLSKKYPDILAKLNTWINKETKSFVLDCETVAWDMVEKKVLPFQQLMTRKRKDVKVEDVKVKGLRIRIRHALL